MASLPIPRIQPLSEDDITSIVVDAGGGRAHADSDRRTERNADYLLGMTVVELKLLDDEGLHKRERQEKIAALFTTAFPDKPVVVIDPSALNENGRREYATIMQGPIKNAVRSARGQLKQSRRELDGAKGTVLFVINNGFSALTHEELVDHVARRAKNDSSEIDGIVVAGCYLHSDGFDTFALWPIEHKAINPDHSFVEFEALRSAWRAFADRHMTAFVLGRHGENAAKAAQEDIVFDFGGRTFVKPAIPLGNSSSFYTGRRPRSNPTSFSQIDPFATTIPIMTRFEFQKLRPLFEDEPLFASYEIWEDHVREAVAGDGAFKPIVQVAVSRGGWEAWKRRHPDLSGVNSLRLMANDRFNRSASDLVRGAQDMSTCDPPRKSCIAVLTEIIGQDEMNDVSHINLLRFDGRRHVVEAIVRNARIPFLPALSLGAAHAVKMGLSSLYWQHDLEHAWL